MCSSLKNSIIQRNTDGNPSGERTISLTTLLDVLSNRTVPIVRPVLQTIRMLVAESSNQISDVDQIEFQNLGALLEQINAYIDSQGGLAAAAEEGIGLPAWYRTINGLFKLFPMGDKYSGSGYTVSEDAEFFRSAAPSDKPGSDTLQGLTILTKSEERNEQYAEHPDQFIQPIQASLRRAHGPTLRALEKGGTEVVIPADKAQVLGYVVFPYKTILSGAMGHIRPGTLWETMRRGMAEKNWMSKLLKQLGGVQSTKDTNSVFYVAQNDASAVGVQFSDYLQLLLKSLIPTGPGDLAALKRDLGINDLELTLDQQAVVQTRVEEVRGSLRSMIIQMRTKEPPAAPTIHGFFQDDSILKHLEALGTTHPYIGDLLKQMGTRTPGYKQVDIAAMAYLMLYAKDYVATAYGGANPKGAEKARIRLALEASLQKLQAILGVETLRRTQGQPPRPNPCEHTEALTMIRKVRDEKERMVLLIKFLSKYKGLRDENWVTCSVCTKHLICQHEILQIQQFLNPRDKNALQKEIVLNYAGGLFGSNYICRNCGLPIQELGYDTSIEYDDQGRPMMGRDVLVDKDFLEELEMKLLLSGAYEEEGATQQQGSKDPTTEKPEITGILRILTDTLGISLDKKSLRTLVGRIDADFAQIMKEANYIAEKKKRLEEKKERLPDYADYLARKKIAISAAHLLLEIQTHSPDYVVEFFIEGCASPGFGGYPIQRGSSPDSSEQTSGIQYMACAVAGIVREDAPWVDGFQKLSNADQKRRKTIQNMITLQLKQAYQGNTIIQQEMEQKRIYIEQLYGAAAALGRPSERLPSDFLPRMEYTADANANAAASPMIAEGAKGSFGELLKADTWIRSLNRLAKNGTKIVQGSPYSEASCCVSPIGRPGESIQEAQLPSMPELYTLKPGFVRQTIMYTPMIPRDLQPFNATPSLEVAYRVFLQLCWKGPRVGLAHELGYDHKCDWCDTEIPTEYLYPDVNYAGTPLIDEQALRSTFDTQGIPLTKESFQGLLDAAHNRTAFLMYRVPALPPALQVVEHVSALPSPPVVDWSVYIKETQVTLAKLPVAASDAEVAIALGPLRDSLASAEDAILSKLGGEKIQLLLSILQQAPQTIFEVARSYFLVPSRRLLTTQFQASSRLKIENKYFKLSKEHVTLLHTVLEDHTDYLKQPLTDKDGFLKQTMKKAQLKLEYFVEQLSECIRISSELRLSRVRYDETLDLSTTERFLKEVIRAMIVGPIGSLLDPTFVPSEGEGEMSTDASGTSDRFLASFVNSILNKYKVERLSYDPLRIRQKLEESKEREKQRFIGELDRMKPEEKALELVKKRIGIGKWAIGGTKLVYAYDPEQWEKNRQENLSNYSGSVGQDQAQGQGQVQGQPILLQDGLEQPDLQTADGGYDNFDNHGDGDTE